MNSFIVAMAVNTRATYIHTYARVPGLLCSVSQVLTPEFDSKYKTCDGFCNAHGLTCLAAWEEDAESCKVKHTLKCDQTIDSSDALCECNPADAVGEDGQNRCDEWKWPVCEKLLFPSPPGTSRRHQTTAKQAHIHPPEPTSPCCRFVRFVPTALPCRKDVKDDVVCGDCKACHVCSEA